MAAPITIRANMIFSARESKQDKEILGGRLSVQIGLKELAEKLAAKRMQLEYEMNRERPDKNKIIKLNEIIFNLMQTINKAEASHTVKQR